MKLDSTKTEIYYSLLDLDDKQKSDALKQLKINAPDLYNQVSALVDAEDAEYVEDIFQLSLLNGAFAECDYSGQHIDKYHILHELGRGGLGVVYAACRADQTFEQQLAIKFLQSDLSQIFGNRALFDEAQLLAKLSHPHIAKVFDGGIHNGDVYIVMEQVEGESLDAYLATHSLNKREKLRLFVQLCSAIEHGHQQGVVHGDLKPENILIDGLHHVKLIDFNLTQKASEQSSSASEGLLAFSKEYASPEQQAGCSIGPASDIYSLGKLLIWLFPEEKRFSDLLSIQRKATQAKIAARYSCVELMRRDVEAILAKRPVSLRQHVPFYPSLRLFQRHPLTCTLCLTLAVSGVFFSSALVNKNRQLEREKLVAENMIFEVSSMMFHSKTQAAQNMPLHMVVDATRRRILSNPDIPKHIKQKLLLVMMTPIEEKAADSSTSQS